MMIGSEGKTGSQDFELNLASIIDCLTVLIAFILASASFLSISILDAGVAASAPAAKDTPPPSINITVELAPANALVLKVTGKQSLNHKLAEKNGTLDLDGLTTELAGLKAHWPDANAVVLTADNAVEYNSVVKAMESIRKTIPAVLLGGF